MNIQIFLAMEENFAMRSACFDLDLDFVSNDLPIIVLCEIQGSFKAFKSLGTTSQIYHRKTTIVHFSFRKT